MDNNALCDSILIEVKDLTKCFNKKPVINGVSFQFKERSVYGLIGANGSGKSVLLDMMLGVTKPSSGSIYWQGEKINSKNSNRKIGVVSSDTFFYQNLTAYKNLKLICLLKRCPKQAIVEQLKLVSLWESKDVKVGYFSDGMKQRLSVAAAMLNQPKLVIIDGLTERIDMSGVRHVRKLLSVLAAKGNTIIITSHVLHEIEEVCSDFIFLKQGKLLSKEMVGTDMTGPSYFEINATTNLKMVAFLKKQPEVASIRKAKNHYLLFLAKPLKAGTLANRLTKEGITLTHLLQREPSLETTYLNLTENDTI